MADGPALPAAGGTLVWITGASSGIGRALALSARDAGARVVGISRRREPPGIEHVEADLGDPRTWARVARSFEAELAGFTGRRVVLVQSAGAVDPVGFAGDVDTDAYATSVILDSAAPQVLGHLFLRAVREVPVDRHLVMLTSGAARSVYPGWSLYGAAKAALDQWVRTVGAEQRIRGGVHVLGVAPGLVDTPMQTLLRTETTEAGFPSRARFLEFHETGQLTDPADVARTIWTLLDAGLDTGTVIDLRDPAAAAAVARVGAVG
ncbi:MAG TPA: SDR family NAD(P)-dependent oxidoreductase [Candidatus Dormibacteraeota bacterium]|nr:SDR family NAD(P)-dependent oxidoreductase [Candidatus Dormibacteraeota bacterium]